MNMQSAPAPLATFAPLRLAVHLLVAGSAAVISPFTALAWPFALLVGVLIGSADAKRMRGEPDSTGDAVARGFLAAIGVLAMLFFGAIVGGLIAIAVVALAAFSEKAAAHASPTDRGVARILLFMVPIVAWLIVFPLLGLDVDIRIGG
ncbi:MAG TPA: hypothetical protein VLA76_03910 [Candidatus Angelobacter sp.]|nr:hypothetical protein [Candidatus Angelobacter sp.]